MLRRAMQGSFILLPMTTQGSQIPCFFDKRVAERSHLALVSLNRISDFLWNVSVQFLSLKSSDIAVDGARRRVFGEQSHRRMGGAV